MCSGTLLGRQGTALQQLTACTAICSTLTGVWSSVSLFSFIRFKTFCWCWTGLSSSTSLGINVSEPGGSACRFDFLFQTPCRLTETSLCQFYSVLSHKWVVRKEIGPRVRPLMYHRCITGFSTLLSWFTFVLQYCFYINVQSLFRLLLPEIVLQGLFSTKNVFCILFLL